MREVFILSTYNLPVEEQWDLCRMVERAGIFNFEFLTLEDYQGKMDQLVDLVLSSKEKPIVITLDDITLEYSQAQFSKYARLIPWYRPSNHVVPPKVAGQQLHSVLTNKATTEDID